METKSNFLIGVIILAVALAAVALGMAMKSTTLTPVTYLQASTTAATPSTGLHKTSNIAAANDCNAKLFKDAAVPARKGTLTTVVDDAGAACLAAKGVAVKAGKCGIDEDGCNRSFAAPGTDPDGDPIMLAGTYENLVTGEMGDISVSREGQVFGGPSDMKERLTGCVPQYLPKCSNQSGKCTPRGGCEATQNALVKCGLGPDFKLYISRCKMMTTACKVCMDIGL